MSEHTEAQEWEAGWWGNCTRTFGEEAKQITYAHRMGLEVIHDDGRWPTYDLAGRTVVDLGGGPTSILLKCANPGKKLAVVDPLPYPDWVIERYVASGISFPRRRAESFQGRGYDEAWIYNVLQHVIDPERVIAVARRAAKTVRIFEWIGAETNAGHPHSLDKADLDRWLGGVNGMVEAVDENSAVGLAYFGAFPS